MTRSTRALVTAVMLGLCSASTVVAQSVGQFTVAWDASPDPDAVGYMLYIGPEPGHYTFQRDVSAGLSFTYSAPVYGTYYIALKSYNAGAVLGPWSEEIAHTLPAPPPPPPPSAQCVTAGISYPIGARVTWSGRNGDADAFIAARAAESWVVISRTKVRNTTTVVLECRAQ